MEGGEEEVLETSTEPFRMLPNMVACEDCGRVFFPWSLKTHKCLSRSPALQYASPGQAPSRRHSLDDRLSVDEKTFVSLSDGEEDKQRALGAKPRWFPKTSRLSSATTPVSKYQGTARSYKGESPFSVDRIHSTSENARLATAIGNEPVERNASPGNRSVIDLTIPKSERAAHIRPQSASRVGNQNTTPSSARNAARARSILSQPVSRTSLAIASSPPRRAPDSPPVVVYTPLPPVANQRAVPMTPPMASPFERKSLSAIAREERDVTERARRSREEELVRERDRLQRELNRINDELREIRVSRTKTQQTVAPRKGHGSPSPTIRPRFDYRSGGGFDARTIDPSNASSPDNPLVTNYMQTISSPRIVPRGTLVRFGA